MVDLEKYKLSRLFWEGDTNEEGFFVHLENFGSMVRATASGHHLEDMLDSKLHRAPIMKGSVPSFLLLDPDFAGGAPIIEAADFETIAPPIAPGEGSVASEEPAAVEDDSASVNATVNVASAAVPSSSAVGSATTGGTGGTFTLGIHKTAYKDLPAAARKCDAILYNIFKLSIRGSKQALLKSVTFPSYVQAVIVLVKHELYSLGLALEQFH